MDLYRKESAKRFGNWLRSSLKKKYPHVKITANFLATQYNIRAMTSDTISNETSRKWLNGTTLPSVHRFQILKNWLGSDAEFLATYDDINNPINLEPSSIRKENFEILTSKISESKLFSAAQIEYIRNLHSNIIETSIIRK